MRSLTENTLTNLGRILKNKFLLVVRFHSDGSGEDESNGAFHVDSGTRIEIIIYPINK
jgi:hypothetical protein